MARVLLVEDDADIAQLVARRLRSYGHTITIAPSARLALNCVGLDNPVDIAVLDINLPATNGFQLLEQLRRHPELDNAALPAVFLSAATTPENMEKAEAMNVAFLPKPFVSGELQGAIAHALDTTWV